MANTSPLCRTCRNLNLKFETFVQTGWRCPTSLRYQTTAELLDGLDPAAEENVHYVEGERLSDNNAMDYDGAHLEQKLEASPLRHVFDENGDPLSTAPFKLQKLGTLGQVREKAGLGCELCRLVTYVVNQEQLTHKREAGQGGKMANCGPTFDDSDECTIRFDFKDIEAVLGSEEGEREGGEREGGERGEEHDRDDTGEKENCPVALLQDHGYYECSVSIGRQFRVPVYPLFSSNGMGWFGGRLTQPEIDYSLVRGWLQSCESLHPTCSRERYKIDVSSVGKLRVIDVRNACLATIQTHEQRFVALSYVWGSSPVLKTTTHNLRKFSEPRGLDLSVNEIPRTIRDAMNVVRSLDLQFLWTDSLCIVQDDPQTMQDLLRKMDLIYASAYFTIVAAEGSDASAGLPGTSHENSRRVPQVFPYGESLQLFPAGNDLHEVLLECPWSARAWTLQEALMSPRLLIFTNNGIHFTCSSLSWSENLKSASEMQGPPWKHVNENVFHFRSNLTSEDLITLNPSVGTMWNMELWIQMVMELSERKLKFETDILFASAGLTAQLERFYKVKSLYGLPEHHLEEFLSWSPMFPGTLRRRRDVAQDTFNPSWSWSGWVGEVGWPGGDAEDVELDYGSHVSISKLDTVPGWPLPVATSGSHRTHDPRTTYPYLRIFAQTSILRVSKILPVPEKIKDLHPLAWHTVLPERAEREAVHCIYSSPSQPIPAGSVVFDCRDACEFEESFDCMFLRISSRPQQLNFGTFLGEVFHNVLAIQRVGTADHGDIVADRIGHGKVLVKESESGWERATVILR